MAIHGLKHNVYKNPSSCLKNMDYSLDKKDIGQILKRMEASDNNRDALIKGSRDVVKLSKKVISSVLRGETEKAPVNDIKASMKVLDSMVKKQPKLIGLGSYKVAVQEFVEALAFFSLVKDGKLITNSELGVDDEYYLMGLCDLTGEISRKAIHAVIDGDYKEALRLQRFVASLYSELSLYDYQGGELRKKYDSIKYDLKKLEEVILELKVKGKL